MKIVVFGATGSVGSPFVERALFDEHDVTAFARHPEKLNMHHPHLTYFAGDAMDRDAVSRAVRGNDVVVVTLGSGMDRKSIIRSVGTRNIIDAMTAHGLRRLICQSTLGAHESWNNLNFFWKRIMFGFLLRPVFLDHEKQEDLVRDSDLDWILVRPGAFTNGPALGTYRENFAATDRKLDLKISRADVADFLMRQLSERRYVHHAVGISY